MTEVATLADEFVEAMFDAEPLWPVLLGIPSSRTGLGDLSAEAEQAYRATLAGFIERAGALDPAGLSAPDRVTRDVLINQAQGALDEIGSHWAGFNISGLFVSPAAGLLTSLPMIPVTGPEDAAAQLERLAAIPGFLQQSLQRLRDGVAAGLLPVAPLVEGAIAQIDRYLADPAGDPLLRQPAPDDEFEQRRAEVLRDVVHPGFAAYRDALIAEIAPHGRPEEKPGVCWLPEGKEIYTRLARKHTTTDRTPESLHATGLEIIGRLAREYRDIGSRVFGTDDLTEIFERLRTDPALRWTSAEELLDGARAAITRADEAAPAWFGRIPPQEWKVEAVPADSAPAAPPAYYMQPSSDGTRPGIYFANTHQVTERHKHVAEAMAFHEAIPGHHFQLSTALGLDDLPLLRRIGDFNAYVEGWGLYSERLAHEMGLYSGDVALLGMLTLDSMRAGRLVVDTGLHSLGWSRQKAVDFLAENTPMALVEIEAEIDRYIAFPGQALSYMVGRLEILRIRETAEKALGERFDIKEFHDLVLGGGALPLSVLDSVVAEWVAGK
ncbi:MAG: hypothetical protein QOI21_1239 [Actinomycetota bacterium]|jgi:uncharacterized protein (DUF885 family)|nr:hypothetical protein [Actinomycetota bacterium]